MMHAGVPLLLGAGVHVPALHDGDRSRVALEGYPGCSRANSSAAVPGKSDARAADRRAARRREPTSSMRWPAGTLGLALRLESTRAHRRASSTTRAVTA